MLTDRRLPLQAVDLLRGSVDVEDLPRGGQRQDRVEARTHDRRLELETLAELELDAGDAAHCGRSRKLFVSGGHMTEDKAAAMRNRTDWPDVGVILEARQ